MDFKETFEEKPTETSSTAPTETETETKTSSTPSAPPSSTSQLLDQAKVIAKSVKQEYFPGFHSFVDNDSLFATAVTDTNYSTGNRLIWLAKEHFLFNKTTIPIPGKVSLFYKSGRFIDSRIAPRDFLAMESRPKDPKGKETFIVSQRRSVALFEVKDSVTRDNVLFLITMMVTFSITDCRKFTVTLGSKKAESFLAALIQESIRDICRNFPFSGDRALNLSFLPDIYNSLAEILPAINKRNEPMGLISCQFAISPDLSVSKDIREQLKYTSKLASSTASSQIQENDGCIIEHCFYEFPPGKPPQIPETKTWSVYPLFGKPCFMIKPINEPIKFHGKTGTLLLYSEASSLLPLNFSYSGSFSIINHYDFARNWNPKHLKPALHSTIMFWIIINVQQKITSPDFNSDLTGKLKLSNKDFDRSIGISPKVFEQYSFNKDSFPGINLIDVSITGFSLDLEL